GLDSAFVELKGQDDPVHLEEDAGIMDLGRQLIGEMGDQILGQPGVDLLIGEDRLPRGLVADIVAQLQALGEKMLGLDLALLVGKADHRAIIGGLVRQGEPDRRRDRNADSEEGSRPDEPLGQHLEHRRTHLVWKGQNDGKRPAHGEEESGCRLRGPDVYAWSNRFAAYGPAKKRSTRTSRRPGFGFGLIQELLAGEARVKLLKERA